MNKAKTASAKARRLNRNGANEARHNGAPRKTRNPTGHADLGSTTSNSVERKGTLADQRSGSRYQALFDLVPVAVYSIDTSGVIENFNRRAAELWGREPALGDTDQRFCGSFKMFRPDGSFMPHEQCPMAEVVSGKITAAHDTEVLIERPDGSRVTVLVIIRPLKNDRGEVIGAINCFYDITERKKNEHLLAEAARQQSALYELVQRRQEAGSMREIYDAALDAIISALRCDRASILLFDNNDVIRFVAWRGLSERYRKAVQNHLPWKADVKDPQPIFIADVDLAELPKALKTAIKAEGIRAAAFIPLITNRKLIGKFMTYYDRPHVFAEAEMSLAVNIARQLTLAIEHQRADEAVRESEARMRAIIEQATAGMARCDTAGRILFVNKRFCQMVGYEPPDLIGKTIEEITHPDDVGQTDDLFERMIREGKPYEVEKRYLRKDGSVLWVDVSASAVRDEKGRTQSAVAVVVDVSARKKAEAELKKSKAMLEKLVQQRTKALRVANTELENEITRRKGLEGQILEISDREQERLGQELHDGLCQQLTAIGFLARAIALRLKDHRVVETEDLEKIAQLINSSVMDARNIARDLHKEEIEAAELVPALRDLAERKIWKTPCRLDLKTEVNIEDDNVASQLYRILREALINANKHARATQIVLKVRRMKNELLFSVSDNGVGLRRKPKAGHGLGFHIMEYRAKSIGARLEFESRKKGGSRVACYLPLSMSK
jgi:PAS domain S-box-containing protein